MAYIRNDLYLILSDGLYAGALDETLDFEEKLVRILSHGLLDAAPSPAVATGIAGIGMFIREGLLNVIHKVFSQGGRNI